MNGLTRLYKLLIKGEWTFVASGREYVRGGLKFRARINILYHRVANLLRLPYCFGVPYSLTVEPASICNLRCPACPAGIKIINRRPALLSLEDFKKTIDMIGDYLVRILLWNWGEPFLNRDVYEMIEYANKKGIIVVTSSNGHYFDNAESIDRLLSCGLANLIISIDGTTQETYEFYRVGGNLEKVLNGARGIIDAKKQRGVNSPDVNLRFMINSSNEGQLKDFQDLASGLGADDCTFRVIYSGLAGQPEKCRNLLPKNDSFVFKKAEKQYDSKCMLFWYMPVLYSNGRIGMCKMDALGEAEVMHISEAASFGQIWNSETARKYRKNIKKDPEYSFCKDCFCREPEFDNVNIQFTYDNSGKQNMKVVRNRYE